MSLLESIRGTIGRRVLLNYRADPAVVQSLLPPPFVPKLHKGYAVVGICMIRFKQLRPNFLPQALGMNSENAAHRFAVTWDDSGVQREGVYIPRRDSNSIINQTLGGRVFPGFHERSLFSGSEEEDRIHVQITSHDGLETEFKGTVTSELTAGSVFDSVDEAAEFFQGGSTGYSATRTEGHFQGLELEAFTWEFEPMSIEVARSHFFEDSDRFPPGSIELDSALVMRNIEHRWISRPDLVVDKSGVLLTH